MAANAGSQVRVGDVIAGKYRVEKILGRGGMGMVVAAQHLGLRELRAIKFMLPAGLRDKQAVERFRREAEAASRLKSGHALKIHDIDCLDNGALYIVMEHLEGQDLKAVAKERGTLPLREACLYVMQACEAIAEAHAAGIVHRDLKTGNLFLTRGPRGEPWVKVLDFGVAKVTDPAGVVRLDITETKLTLGSPAFMAPEQMRSARKADARSDIWAFGVILYKLTTGVLPFDGPSVNQVAMRILSPECAQPPSTHKRALPPLFDAIVLRCLEKDEKDRFQNVLELADAIRSLREHVPVPTQADDTKAIDEAEMSAAFTLDMVTRVQSRAPGAALAFLPADPVLPARLPSIPTLLPLLTGSLTGKPSTYTPPAVATGTLVDVDETTKPLPARAPWANESPDNLPAAPSPRPRLRLASVPTMPDTRMALVRRGISIFEDTGSAPIAVLHARKKTPDRYAMSVRSVIVLSVFVGSLLGAMTFWIALSIQSSSLTHGRTPRTR